MSCWLYSWHGLGLSMLIVLLICVFIIHMHTNFSHIINVIFKHFSIKHVKFTYSIRVFIILLINIEHEEKGLFLRFFQVSYLIINVHIFSCVFLYLFRILFSCEESFWYLCHLLQKQLFRRYLAIGTHDPCSRNS